MYFPLETNGFPPVHLLPAIIVVPIVFAPPTVAQAVATSIVFVLQFLVVVAYLVSEALLAEIMSVTAAVFYFLCLQPQLKHQWIVQQKTGD